MVGSLMLLCLVFSGLSALVYQLIWTRLLGFTFGTTTEAIGSVLAIFFGGMALGNLLAARVLSRVERPLRIYALLELGIGAFAFASLVLLRDLHHVYAWVGVDHGPLAMTLLRLGASAAVLLPPTIAMGATLPVVARGLVVEDRTLGRSSALLYAANTLGAVLGAYLCGFWLIPFLGLTRSVLAAGSINLCVAALVLVAGRGHRVAAAGPRMPRAAAFGVKAPLAPPGVRGAFLGFFGISGFVAIGYEIVWAKVFGIVMEGTLYGFAAVLSAYLLGIALGSFAVAGRVDRIRDLPRAFALLHVAIAAFVALGMSAVPFLPYARAQLADLAGGGDAVHLLFALVLPIVLLPTALFGAAFPVLIRIYARSAAEAGRGIGFATAVNTAGSILASLTVGFLAIPRLGSDATLFALLLLDLGLALVVLIRFQQSAPRQRVAASAGATAVFLTVALSFGGVQVDRTIAGSATTADDLASYRRELATRIGNQILRIEGRASVVTLYDTPSGLQLRTNGLPESGTDHAPPYTAAEMDLLAALPYLVADAPKRALVIGLGGGHTVAALLETDVERIEVVELEPGVVLAAERLHRGRADPLAQPRVELRINDGRNELLLGRYTDRKRYDLIASQPSHPWRVGAANLFTQEFFGLVRENLAAAGIAAIWVNGFRTDAAAFLAVATSFERVFPGALLFAAGSAPQDPRGSLLLLGGREPLELDPARIARRLETQAIGERLALHGIDSVEALLARSEGPLASFAALEPRASNTDDNALLETRVPRRLRWRNLDFAEIEARLATGAPVLPPLAAPVALEAVARRLLEPGTATGAWPYRRKLERLIAAHGAGLDGVLAATLLAEARLRDADTEAGAVRELEALAREHPARPEPLRALGHHRAGRQRDFAAGAEAFAAAFARSARARDGYDAGRALHHVDPEAAWSWFVRIPADERAAHPRLAFYEAEWALTHGTAERAAAAYASLLRYRDTEEGRRLAGVDALLARLAERLGDERAARGFAASAIRARERRAEPLLRRARAAFRGGRHAEASAALDDAEALLPGDPRVPRLRAEIALARGDREGLARRLTELRTWAPDLASAIGSENAFRSRHGLSLLPRQPAEAFFARDPDGAARTAARD